MQRRPCRSCPSHTHSAGIGKGLLRSRVPWETTPACQRWGDTALPRACRAMPFWGIAAGPGSPRRLPPAPARGIPPAGGAAVPLMVQCDGGSSAWEPGVGFGIPQVSATRGWGVRRDLPGARRRGRGRTVLSSPQPSPGSALAARHERRLHLKLGHKLPSPQPQHLKCLLSLHFT